MIEDAEDRMTDDNQDDDELEEVSKQLAAKKGSANKESERKKRELITMGKAKGFLTYDEVNDHLGDDGFVWGPEGLREAFITGGLAPIGRSCDDVYSVTLPERRGQIRPSECDGVEYVSPAPQY